MDIHDTQFAPTQLFEERAPEWAELNDRLRALQDKYASERVDAEPRAFAARFRN